MLTKSTKYTTELEVCLPLAWGGRNKKQIYANLRSGCVGNLFDVTIGAMELHYYGTFVGSRVQRHIRYILDVSSDLVNVRSICHILSPSVTTSCEAVHRKCLHLITVTCQRRASVWGPKFVGPMFSLLPDTASRGSDGMLPAYRYINSYCK